jgi:sodium/hydrogen exchanger 8
MFAAKNLKYNLFFKNFHYIFWFGCVGTFITFFGFFAFIDLFASLGAFPNLTDTEGLLLAAALTATDTVGVLTLIKEKEFPDLFSIIFGEGIINDAVAILLFQAINNMTKANKAGGHGVQSFSLLSLTGFSQLFVEFFYLSIISFCIGIGLGFLLSYLYKIMKISRDESALEISLFF